MPHSLNLFSLEKLVLQTIQESKETNNMIKKIMDTEKQEIGNIIRNNNQVVLKLDLIIVELRKQKDLEIDEKVDFIYSELITQQKKEMLESNVQKLANTDFNKEAKN
tara:strand:- start:92 stop:412 length:321 start_codon:yes stop_codon:yes gene_type:complete